MTKEELKNNLGKIAESGTAKFMDAIKQASRIRYDLARAMFRVHREDWGRNCIGKVDPISVRMFFWDRLHGVSARRVKVTFILALIRPA